MATKSLRTSIAVTASSPVLAFRPPNHSVLGRALLDPDSRLALLSDARLYSQRKYRSLYCKDGFTPRKRSPSAARAHAHLDLAQASRMDGIASTHPAEHTTIAIIYLLDAGDALSLRQAARHLKDLRSHQYNVNRFNTDPESKAFVNRIGESMSQLLLPDGSFQAPVALLSA